MNNINMLKVPNSNKMLTSDDITNKARKEIIFINRCCANGREGLLDYLKAKDPIPMVKHYNLFNSIKAGLLEEYKIDKDQLLYNSFIVDEDGKVIELKN